jgi:hypothetical protein
VKILLEHQGYFQKPADAATKEFFDKFKSGSIQEFTVKGVDEAGSKSMLNTWMMWMDETAAFMRGQGVTMSQYIDSKGEHHGTRMFKKEDAHDLFTSKYLGKDEEGLRKTWSMTKSGEESQASIGDRLHAMDTHAEWCVQRGINLTIPRDGQYRKLKEDA